MIFVDVRAMGSQIRPRARDDSVEGVCIPHKAGMMRGCILNHKNYHREGQEISDSSIKKQNERHPHPTKSIEECMLKLG